MAAISERERVQSQSFRRTESGGISKEPTLEASQNGKGGVAQFCGTMWDLYQHRGWNAAQCIQKKIPPTRFSCIGFGFRGLRFAL